MVESKTANTAVTALTAVSNDGRASWCDLQPTDTLKKTKVPAQGFEPWTIGLKVDLCDVFLGSLKVADVHFVFRMG